MSSDDLRFYDQKSEYGELSNFWETSQPIVYKDKFYATSEHLYQCMKYDYDTAPLANTVHIEAIRTARTPGLAKALANPEAKAHWRWQKKCSETAQALKASGSVFNPRWEPDGKIEAMKIALRAKFTQCDHCRAVLLGTGDRKLIEAAPSDDYWGVGRKGTGRNMLGIMLEQLRAELRE